MNDIIGRDNEKEQLHQLLQEDTPQLAAIYGRRRVGKTYLIRNYFEQQITFEMSGIHNATTQEQLDNFSRCLRRSFKTKSAAPANWFEAFEKLKTCLKPSASKRKRVLFFDEFPWMDTARSGFIKAFEDFWNSWCSRQKNLVIIICGSAAAWMIKKIVNNKGGLHNRVTKRIRLQPFTLQEIEAYLKFRKVNIDRYQILQLYMAMGGIPQYLNEIRRGESAVQAIDRICFSKDGLLTEEFPSLYTSLFDEAQQHTAIINALAKKPAGLSRNEIITACNLSSGGTVTKLLDELSESGFITIYAPFGKNVKDSLYKLTDEYSLFYLKFIRNNKNSGKGTWARLFTSSSWKSWSGLAFESVCLRHIGQIKKALGIGGIHTETSSWRKTPHDNTDKGAQIDLIIDRNDKSINICEIKFSSAPYEITKAYSEGFNNKLNAFLQASKTRKAIFHTLITTYTPVNLNKYTGLIQNIITMDALFKSSDH
ncbi:MAG: ATP-binding protein [Niabella sp.]